MYRKERVVHEEIKNIHGNLREKSLKMLNLHIVNCRLKK